MANTSTSGRRLDHFDRLDCGWRAFFNSDAIDARAAAELTERVSSGLELDPHVDVVVERWQSVSGKKATLDGGARTFEEVARERSEANT